MEPIDSRVAQAAPVTPNPNPNSPKTPGLPGPNMKIGSSIMFNTPPSIMAIMALFTSPSALSSELETFAKNMMMEPENKILE